MTTAPLPTPRLPRPVHAHAAVAAPIPRAERSLAPDIARGAMLLLIALANVGEHTWGRTLDRYGHIADATVVDRAVRMVLELLVIDRTRPMFAILYGFGLAVVAARLTDRGVPAGGVRRVMARRSLGLLVLGMAHAVLLFAGDILTFYGATGLVVLMLVTRSDRTVRRWLWGSLVYVLVGFTVLLAALLSGVLAAEAGPSAVSADYGTTVANGVATVVADLFAALVLLGFLPLVLVGVLVQRAGWLQHPDQHRVALRRGLAWGMVAGVLSATPSALIAVGAWTPGPLGSFGAAYLTLVGGMVAGLGYVCGFALLAVRWAARGRTGAPGALAALGERSLTGYLAQSVVFAPVLAPWGLGWGRGMSDVVAACVAIAVWALTVGFCRALERRGHRGPFEVLLRRITYGRRAAVTG